MTICFLASALSVHTQRWAAYFSGRGHSVHLISFHPVSIRGVQVYPLFLLWPIKEVTYLLALPKVKWLVQKIRPDILHAHYASSYGFLGALTGYHPLVTSAWGSDVLLGPKESRLARWVVQFALERAALVTSMAHHMTRTLIELGVPRDKILTLPFGADTTIFHPQLPEPGQRAIDIICTRNFEPIYNLELLIRALRWVIARRPETECVLVGDGPLRTELKRLAQELGVESNVKWVGRVPLPEVAEWLRRAKVFVTPALSDGNNVSLNEAMACGCFPIASDIPANREWLVDGETGFIVPGDRPEVLAERILQAFDSEMLRRQAADRNWLTVQARTNWHTSMVLMEEHYRRLTNGHAERVGLPTS